MKNVKEQSSTLENVSSIYIIAYGLYFIYYLNSSFTWLKAIILIVGLFIALILLIIETINYHKKPF